MTKHDAAADFRASWPFVRSLTVDFVAGAPAEAWDSRPALRYGTLAQQFRHVLQVTDLYRSGLETGALVPGSKQGSYSGSLDRQDLLAGLWRADAQLDSALTAFVDGPRETIGFGAQDISLGAFLHIITEHEANHHGLWSAYAAAADFTTPSSWQEAWDL